MDTSEESVNPLRKRQSCDSIWEVRKLNMNFKHSSPIVLFADLLPTIASLLIDFNPLSSMSKKKERKGHFERDLKVRDLCHVNTHKWVFILIIPLSGFAPNATE